MVPNATRKRPNSTPRVAPESAASAFAMNDDFRFPAGDPEALRAKIDALIEDRPKLEAARGPYRERARQFDFDASVGRMVEIAETSKALLPTRCSGGPVCLAGSADALRVPLPFVFDVP